MCEHSWHLIWQRFLRYNNKKAEPTEEKLYLTLHLKLYHQSIFSMDIENKTYKTRKKNCESYCLIGNRYSEYIKTESNQSIQLKGVRD